MIRLYINMLNYIYRIIIKIYEYELYKIIVY